ncbi:hypothetical protein [Rhodopirellula bahusiensis]|uniref:hypothetical protein n=1 Tax=Rhodopirellula bahusiensis TaxID=2014065 RepID=UPI003264CF90
MKTLLLIATRDFHSSAGKHIAGQTIASIETNLASGELVALLNGSDRVAVEVDDDGEDPPTPDAEPTGDDTPDGDLDTSAQTGTETEGNDEDANRLLSDLIESRPLKLFAALDPPVTTVAELAVWMADGNLPRQISGIAETTEEEVLEATGLALPA